jgi:hypothetical protein
LNTKNLTTVIGLGILVVGDTEIRKFF